MPGLHCIAPNVRCSCCWHSVRFCWYMCPRRASEHIAESPSAQKAILSSVLSGRQTAAQKIYTARSSNGWDTRPERPALVTHTYSQDCLVRVSVGGELTEPQEKTTDKLHWVYLLSITEEQCATLNQRVKTFSRRWQIVCLPLRWENSKGLQPQSPKGKREK